MAAATPVDRFAMPVHRFLAAEVTGTERRRYLVRAGPATRAGASLPASARGRELHDDFQDETIFHCFSSLSFGSRPLPKQQALLPQLTNNFIEERPTEQSLSLQKSCYRAISASP